MMQFSTHLKIVPLCLIISLMFLGQLVYSQENAQDNQQDISLDSLLSIPVNSAVKSWQKVKETPASVTIVTDKDIARFGYRNLEDVFSSVRGFYVSNDRNYSYIGVRGFSRPTDYNNRILLLINGQTVNEPIYGGAPMGFDFPINMEVIERIEIIRGPGSVAYGTGAMFATVNVVTKSGKTYNNIVLSGEIETLGQKRIAGTFGKEISDVSVALSANFAQNTGQSFYFKEFDTDSTLGGKTPKSADVEKYFSVTSLLEYKNLQFQSVYNFREVHIPTAPYGLIFGDSRTQTTDSYATAELKFNQELSVDKTLMVRAFYHRYYYTGTYPYTTYVSDEITNSNTIGTELLFKWDISVSNRLTVGAQYQNVFTAHLDLTPDENRILNIHLPFQVYSLYAMDEHQITDEIAVNLGFRIDEYSAGFSALSPRAAVIVNPTASSTLKFLYGSAFRSPNIYETNYEDVPTMTKANHSLKPENINTLEFVAEQQIGEEFYVVGSLYRSTIKDIIVQNISDVDSFLQFQNISSNTATGFEIEVNAKLSKGISMYSSFNYQYATDSSTKTTLNNSPSVLLKFGISQNIPFALTAAADFHYETARKTEHDTETKPFFLANLTISSVPIFGHLKLGAQIRNLLNTEYSYPGGQEHRQQSITQDKRCLSIKASWQF
ncbi:MAG: TonB-dependent receptor [Ignavibacteriae bacterium]|nr:TonB-dependent receptor [Ignavibacteriota bacterium]